MKHIIVEGCDRVGKNTLIEYLCSTAQNYTVRHFSKPIGKSNDERIEYQKKDFLNEFRMTNLCKPDGLLERDPSDLYIWNRAHIGEWVYGQMYRNYKPEWIWEYERLFSFNSKDIYLIMLYAEPEFLVEREDGNSLSAKLEDRIKEINLFHEAYDLSIIPNKLKICVNEDNEYFSKEYIREQCKKFLFG